MALLPMATQNAVQQLETVERQGQLYAGDGRSGHQARRTKCLSTHRFMNPEDTAKKLGTWRKDDNEERPHGAMGNNEPAALSKLPDASSPSA